VWKTILTGELPLSRQCVGKIIYTALRHSSCWIRDGWSVSVGNGDGRCSPCILVTLGCLVLSCYQRCCEGRRDAYRRDISSMWWEGRTMKFRVGNSTWSHGVGVSTDLTTNFRVYISLSIQHSTSTFHNGHSNVPR